MVSSASKEPSRNGVPIAVFWDIENCRIPVGARPEDVAGNIRKSLRMHSSIRGTVFAFSAYGDFHLFSKRIREGCQRTGVKLIDVPNGRKDASDKAILIDMFLFALDNPPPSCIALISGDVDFAPALHVLGQRGYTIVLVIPSGAGVSSALLNAGNLVCDWAYIASGRGIASPSRGPLSVLEGGRMVMEEQIVPRDLLVVSQNLPENGVPPEACKVTGAVASPSPPSTTVRTKGIKGLSLEMVKLLQMNGGWLPIGQIRSKYHNMFGIPLQPSDYGENTLAKLFKKMNASITLHVNGKKKLVSLRDQDLPPSMNGGAASEEERTVVEEHRTIKIAQPTSDEMRDCVLEVFRHELQEILVSYSCCIFLDSFEAVYEKRHKKMLDYREFGVEGLEQLLEMMGGVVVVLEDPLSKKKFVAAC